MPIASTVTPTRLIRLQLGQETTWGTLATATTIINGLSGLPKLTPLVKDVIFDEQRGSLIPAYSAAQLATGASFDMAGWVTFEDIMYLLGGVYGAPVATGVPALKTISAESQASPTQITTSTPHGFTNGQTVVISGVSTGTFTGGYAAINNIPLVITYVDTTKFTVPVACTVAGTNGSVGLAATWTYTVPTTTTFTPVVYTMELGTLASATATTLTGATFQGWTINGEQEKELTFTAKGFGKTVAYGATATAALSYRTTEVALTPEVTFALDVGGATAGTTPYTGTLVSFALSGDSGLVPYYSAGSKAPIGFTYTKQQMGLKVGLVYSSALQSATAFSNLLSGKTAIIQLVATSGAKTITVNFSGALKADPVYFEDSQGAQMVSLDLDAVCDATDSYYAQVVVCNSVSSLA